MAVVDLRFHRVRSAPLDKQIVNQQASSSGRASRQMLKHLPVIRSDGRNNHRLTTHLMAGLIVNQSSNYGLSEEIRCPSI